MRRSRYWLLLPLPFAFLAVFALYLPAEETPLLTSADAWSVVTGDFRVASVTRQDVFTEKMDSRYVVAGRFAGDGSGRLESRAFPGRAWLSLMVIGDLTHPGNDVYFRRVEGGERLPVRVNTSPYFWRRVTLRLPADWVGQPVELVAEAGPREASDTFGLSNPRALGWGALLRAQMRSLAVLPVFGVALTLFLLPGLPAAVRLALRGRLSTGLVVPAAVLFSCMAGYLTFWAYFLHPMVGRCFGGALLVVGAALLAADLRRRGEARALLLSGDVRTPLALTAFVGLFYLALLYAVDLDVRTGGEVRVRFLDFPLAIDNEIPYYFADHLYDHRDPRRLIADVHSSDRPPLQVGLLLLQFPVARLVGQPLVYSLVAGCAFQCAWVPAVWGLWASAGLPRRRAGLALLFVVLTGFATVNTVFGWPKMLAASATLFAVTLSLFGRAPGRPFPAVLVGLSAALGALAHGGVAFTLLPLGLLLLWPRYYPGRSRLAIGAAVFTVTLTPWSLYQTYYDPPGNRLVRDHLAGESPTWRDDAPLWRNLLDAYGELSAGEVVGNKLANLKVLFRGDRRPAAQLYPWPPNRDSAQWPADAIGFRRCEFTCLFWSLGLLNLGWLAALATGRRRAGLDPTLGVTVPALGLASVFAWVVLMFGPGSTVIHQGSYATVLLLFAALAAWLTALPLRLACPLLLLQGIVFISCWLSTSPANAYGPPNVFMIPLAVGFFVALAAITLGPPQAKSELSAGDQAGGRASNSRAPSANSLDASRPPIASA
jgi:hypothetical protein